MDKTPDSRLTQIRAALAGWIDRRLVGPGPLPTIIAEDCWGGELCRRLGLPYNTPLAGVYIPAIDYLTFLENIGKKDAFDIVQLPSAESYPVGRSPYATFHFLHYETWEEAETKFRRRAERMQSNQLCFKIDFGKPEYVQADVERWNRFAATRRTIALLKPGRQPVLDFSGVAQTLPMPDWNVDGSAMFSIARRHFDLYYWLRTGKLRRTRRLQVLHFLITDPFSLNELKNKLRRKTQSVSMENETSVRTP